MKVVDNTIYKQLIPGNPGTSFVVALMYVLSKKYDIKLSNEDQLKLFTDGIVNSRKNFFGGILVVIAEQFKKEIEIIIGDKFVYQRSIEETANNLITIQNDFIDVDKTERLLEKHKLITLSVDINLFLPYHDYHFVALEKVSDRYQVFEPKGGNVYDLPAIELEKLVSSIREGLNDTPMAFCI